MRAAGLRRPLATELRRGAAPWATLAGLGVGAILVAEYRGVPVIVVGDGRQMLVLLMPLLLGVGAWQAGRDRRSGVVELLTTTPLPGWRRRVPTACAVALGALAGALAPSVALLVAGAVSGAYAPTWLVPALLITATYGLAAALWGLALGRLAPWRVVPALLVLLGFVSLTALTIVTDPEGDPDGLYPATWLLVPASGEGINDFERLTAPVLAAQGVWALALAAAALALYLSDGRRRLLAVLPAVAGLLVAGAFLPRHLHEGVLIDAGATELVCTTDDPQVCARRAMPAVLGELVGPGRDALALLAAKLPRAPGRVEAIYYGNDSRDAGPTRDPAVLDAELYLDGNGTTDLDPDAILWTLLLGAGTRTCPGIVDDDSWQDYDAARLVAAAWVLGERPIAPVEGDGLFNWLPPTSVTHPAYDALLALPEAEQRERVAALRDAELTCAPGDRLELLLGGTP